MRIRKPTSRCMIVTVGAIFAFWKAPEASAQPKTVLEEVIVTAQKREQRLQDVPMAVTAVSRELIESNEVNSMEDLAKIVPSMRLTPNGSGGAINIRGVGSNVFSIAIEPSVSVMVDGVVLARTSLSSFDFADIERVEVLRGPQGTLFGKNASAGLIHVITRDPAEEFEGRVRVSYEKPDEFPGSFAKSQFSVSGPIADGLGLRVTGFHKERDGHLEDILRNENKPDTEYSGVRSKLRWDPTDRLSTQLNLEYWTRDSTAQGIYFRDGNPILRERIHPIVPSEENRQMKTFGGDREDLDSRAASFTLDWDLGAFTLTSVTGYRKGEPTTNRTLDGADGKRIDLRANLSEIEIDTFTQELRITSDNNPTLEYTAGVLWFDNEVTEDFYRDIDDIPAEFVANTLFPGLIPPGTGDDLGGADSLRSELRRFGEVKTENLGIFAEGTWHITPSWHLTVGARYIDETVDVTISNFSRLSHSSSGEEIQSSRLPPSSGSVSDTTGTGRISLLHDLTDTSTVYATVSTGYRGGTFDIFREDARAALEEPIDPEKAISYELGYKSRLFDSRLDLNVTAFLTYFEDFQAQVRDLSNPASVSHRLDNAGELETGGLEVEFNAKPTASLSLIGSFLYNRTRYNEFITQCFEGQRPGESGGMDTNGDGICDAQDASGGVLANAPEYSVSITARYDHEFDGGHTLYTLLNGRWNDEIQFANEQHPNTIEDAYGIWNLRVGWQGPAARYEVAGYVDNIFAQNYTRVIVPVSVYRDRRDVVHNIPMDADRVYGLSLSYRW